MNRIEKLSALLVLVLVIIVLTAGYVFFREKPKNLTPLPVNLVPEYNFDSGKG